MSKTIAYDRPVKDLIAGLNATGHVTHKSYKKKSVTIHHNGGNLSHEGVLNVWKTRPASAHFDVDASGAVAQYVLVNEYAWAVGNTQGNCETISIEMANSTGAPSWKVADATIQSAARLAGWLFAHVIGERPSTSNLFQHNHWSSTDCPGPYVKNLWTAFIKSAQEAYDQFKGSAPAPKPTPQSPSGKKSNEAIAAEVWVGKWGIGEDRMKRLRAAGYDPIVIQSLVNKGVGKGGGAPAPKPARKSDKAIAVEVIDGKWGNGADRVARLKAAGYSPQQVQNIVNMLLK